MSPYQKGRKAFRNGRELSEGKRLYTNEFDAEAFECGWLDAEWKRKGCPDEQVRNVCGDGEQIASTVEA